MSSCSRVEASTSSEDRRLLSTTNLPDMHPQAGTNWSVKNWTLVLVHAAMLRMSARSETDQRSSADHNPDLPAAICQDLHFHSQAGETFQTGMSFYISFIIFDIMMAGCGGDSRTWRRCWKPYNSAYSTSISSITLSIKRWEKGSEWQFHMSSIQHSNSIFHHQ